MTPSRSSNHQFKPSTIQPINQSTNREDASNILPFAGEVNYYEEFFSPGESDQYFNQLLKEINWKHEPIKIFGKEVMQPRLTAWYGNADKKLNLFRYHHASRAMDGYFA